MEKNVKKILRMGAVLFLVVILAVGGCKKEKEETPSETPTLPPSCSFVMDFSDFDSSGYLNRIAITDTARVNKRLAVFNVVVWNLILTVGLYVPVASFYEAFKYQAVYQSDGSWQWSYPFLNNVYTAKLNGKVENGKVYWKMYISKQNDFTEFLWYSGESDVKNTEGTWTLYAEPKNATTLLGIVWHRNTTVGTYDIKYMNIVPNGPENGGYIAYGIDNNTPFNAYYNIYNKGQNDLINIEWNRTSKEGRIKAPKFYKNDNWHCWCSGGYDIVCP